MDIDIKQIQNKHENINKHHEKNTQLHAACKTWKIKSFEIPLRRKHVFPVTRQSVTNVVTYLAFYFGDCIYFIMV